MYVKYPNNKERNVCREIVKLENLNKQANQKNEQRNIIINQLQQELTTLQENRKKFKGYTRVEQKEFEVS